MNANNKELLADALGKRIYERRAELGRTLESLSNGDNAINASALSLFERGRKLMSIPQLVEVARELGVKPGALLDAAVDEVGQ